MSGVHESPSKPQLGVGCIPHLMNEVILIVRTYGRPLWQNAVSMTPRNSTAASQSSNIHFQRDSHIYFPGPKKTNSPTVLGMLSKEAAIDIRLRLLASAKDPANTTMDVMMVLSRLLGTLSKEAAIDIRLRLLASAKNPAITPLKIIMLPSRTMKRILLLPLLEPVMAT